MTRTIVLHRLAAVAAAAALLTAGAACSSDKATDATSTAPATSAAAQSATAPSSAVSQPVDEVELPTAAELNAVMAVATDPQASVEEKVQTVQGAEQAPELFETMTKSKQESGANFVVVDPVLPGYTPDSVLATVNFTLPNQEPQTVSEVEFVRENGKWKLAQSWACTLITSAVTPDKVPPMCVTEAPAPAPASGAPAPAPEKK